MIGRERHPGEERRLYVHNWAERGAATHKNREGSIPNREAVNWEEMTIVTPSQQEFQALSLTSWAKGHQ